MDLWAEMYDGSQKAYFSKPSTCKIETAITTVAPATTPSVLSTRNPNSEAPKPVAPEIVAPGKRVSRYTVDKQPF